MPSLPSSIKLILSVVIRIMVFILMAINFINFAKMFTRKMQM